MIGAQQQNEDAQAIQRADITQEHLFRQVILATDLCALMKGRGGVGGDSAGCETPCWVDKTVTVVSEFARERNLNSTQVRCF